MFWVLGILSELLLRLKGNELKSSSWAFHKDLAQHYASDMQAHLLQETAVILRPMKTALL